MLSTAPDRNFKFLIKQDLHSPWELQRYWIRSLLTKMKTEPGNCYPCYLGHRHSTRTFPPLWTNCTNVKRPSVNWILSEWGGVAGGRVCSWAGLGSMASCQDNILVFPYKSCGHRAGQPGPQTDFCLVSWGHTHMKEQLRSGAQGGQPTLLWGQVILRWVNSLWKKGRTLRTLHWQNIQRNVTTMCLTTARFTREREKRLKMIKSRLCRIFVLLINLKTDKTSSTLYTIYF